MTPKTLNDIDENEENNLQVGFYVKPEIKKKWIEEAKKSEPEVSLSYLLKKRLSDYDKLKKISKMMLEGKEISNEDKLFVELLL